MKTLRNMLMGMALLLAACGDDDESSPDSGTLDGSVQLDATAPDAALPDAGAPAQDALYVVGTYIQSGDESSLLVTVGKALDNSALDPSKGLLIAGGGNVAARDGYIYVSETVNQAVTRYTYENGALVKGPSLSFLNKGFMWFSANFGVGTPQPNRAYIVNDREYKLYEWNPTAMSLTGDYDISALRKEGWGQEFRGSFLRSDGKLFLYWAYNNDRTQFLNDFTVGIFDTNTKSFSKVLTEPSCGATAGFGGYFDESEDLYLFGDNFGGFTKFGNYPNAKEACVLRVKKGSDELDPTYKRTLKTVLQGREPWGLYYAGNGFAYTTGIDPAKTTMYATPYELIYAPVHSGWMIDIKNETAKEITGIPPTGVGFQSQLVDGKLLVPRTTGKVKIFDVEATQSTVYDIRTDGSATPVFGLAGDPALIARIR
jgi:hypothetical protein